MEHESRFARDEHDHDTRSGRNGHKIALRFVHGMGRQPTELELADVRQDLAETVRYVDSLIVKIGILEAQVARLESERALMQSCARIESVAKSRAEVVGISEPCGQIMRISHRSAGAQSRQYHAGASSTPGAQMVVTDMYVACMMPGMPICDGRCMIHAQASTPAQATSYASAVMSSTSK